MPSKAHQPRSGEQQLFCSPVSAGFTCEPTISEKFHIESGCETRTMDTRTQSNPVLSSEPTMSKSFILSLVLNYLKQQNYLDKTAYRNVLNRSGEQQLFFSPASAGFTNKPTISEKFHIESGCETRTMDTRWLNP